MAHDLGQLLGRDQRRGPRVDHDPQRRPVTVADLVGDRGDPGVAIRRLAQDRREVARGGRHLDHDLAGPRRATRPAGRAAPPPRRTAPRPASGPPTVRTRPARSPAPTGRRSPGRATSWAAVRRLGGADGRTCRPAGPRRLGHEAEPDPMKRRLVVRGEPPADHHGLDPGVRAEQRLTARRQRPLVRLRGEGQLGQRQGAQVVEEQPDPAGERGVAVGGQAGEGGPVVGQRRPGQAVDGPADLRPAGRAADGRSRRRESAAARPGRRRSRRRPEPPRRRSGRGGPGEVEGQPGRLAPAYGM